MSSWPAFGAGMIAGLLLYMFPACGGGSSAPSALSAQPAPPASTSIADTADHYLPALFARPTRGVLVSLANPAQVFAGWVSQPGFDSWCDVASNVAGSELGACHGQELTELKTCNGAVWAYGRFNDATPAASIDRWTINGVTIDLAQLCPGRPGSYLPLQLLATGTIENEQYGQLLDANGVANRPYYFMSRWTTGLTLFNPCWIGTGATTRPVLLQEECWWDPAAGWVRCHPESNGQLPWFAGQPQAIVVVTENKNYWGRDAGTLWRGTDNGIELCLRNS